MMIREAKPEDMRELSALYIFSWQTTYAGFMDPKYLDSLDLDRVTEKWTRYAEKAGQGVLVAEEDGTIAGLTAYEPFEELECCAILEALHVAPAFRRRGTGTALIRAVAEAARRNGCTKLTINVIIGNRNAQRLYDSLGAKHYSFEDRQFGDRVCATENLIWEDLGVLIG